MSKLLVEYAKELSHKLHSGMFRKDGKTPYTVHTDYVGDNVAKFLVEPTDSTVAIAQAVGYLHDTIEDVVYEETLLKFGTEAHIPYWSEVVARVAKLSRLNKYDPASMKVIPYLTQIAKDEICRAVKMTDLEHNMSDLAPGNLLDKYELCYDYLTWIPFEEIK